MKTWEVIKELTENPNKKFRRKELNSYVTVEGGMIVWRGEFQRGQKMEIGFIDKRDSEWEEVKEPVNFMEVLERVSNNLHTRISLHDEARERIYAVRSLSGILRDLDEEFDSREIAKILLEGKWYIE
ncbi:hypothetical protein CIW83_18225 [Tissierella sp. P1]|uniref:hypothetical protein n=1 Tax=Tissierella sp. P1 TaxID=1280483 RepID=UPI000BA1156F|nr:hypothetical protein [Tissierella sp. P1]OZV10758.1 hypothetical protein CIW83_18225 [Tissierella sp. P1]